MPLFAIRLFLFTQGRIQNFLGDGASQAEMTDVQEELPDMHASAFANISLFTLFLLTIKCVVAY